MTPTTPRPIAILRDDDTGFHTPPAMLEQVYAPAWARGWPVALAVIPAHQGASRVMARRGRPYDPGVPPRFRGDPTERPITDNPALLEYLNDKIRAGLVQIVLHGFNHAWYEFNSSDAPLLRDKITRGLDILHRAFPSAPITFFIAPYDVLSPTAIHLLRTFDLDFCTAPKNLVPAGLPALPGYQHYSDGVRQFYTCDEYLFHRLSEPVESRTLAAQRIADTVNAPSLVFASHFWMFWKNYAELNSPLLDAWHATLDTLAASERAVVRFGE